MRFYIKQKVFSFRDKFRIMDESQKEMYQVSGKFMSVQNKLQLLNMDGSTVLHAKKKVFAILPKYTIFDPHDNEVAYIQRRFAFKPRFDVQVGTKDLRVEGSFWGHSFGIFDGDREVASISKKIISWGDTYEIEVHDDRDTELFLFIVIIIDQVIHEQKKRAD
jgi:uncharacterized protein YxjI